MQIGNNNMTGNEYTQAVQDFFTRYQSNRYELAQLEGKLDTETLIVALANAETTIANLLKTLNMMGVDGFNADSLPPNVLKLMKGLDHDGIYTEFLKDIEV
ncbi:hypothetical protein [Streptococcus danieliae]|uniref:hypothetical protein n=1 Tax=Streptococcus danieliae TaxID=747656 RepID=UPI0026EC5D2C|nr:hypothetical protein [Streptococcus danieliae]